MALGISAKLFNSKLRLYSQLKYNLSDTSGVMIPGFKIDGLSNLSLIFGMPIIFGSETGGYYTDNPDIKDRQVSFILSIILSGKI